MAVSSSLVTKVGAAGTVTVVGGTAGTYFAWDHINYYEVERAVVNGEAVLEVEAPSSSADTSGTSTWIIKTKADNNKWKEGEDGYSWKCEVSGKTSLKLDKASFEVWLSPILGDTRSIRKHLVSVCSSKGSQGDGVVSSNKIVINKLSLPDTLKKEDFSKYLFGEKYPLNETDEKVLEDTVYFKIEDTTTNKFPMTIKATTGDNGTFPTSSGEYSWSCVVSRKDGNKESDSTTFKGKLPTSTPVEDNKLNKKKLVYACATDKNRKKTDKSVEAKFEIPATISSGQESQYIFGS